MGPTILINAVSRFYQGFASFLIFFSPTMQAPGVNWFLKYSCGTVLPMPSVGWSELVI
jgi:hypothetical protein